MAAPPFLRRRSVRLLWQVGGGLLTVAMLVLGTAQVVVALAHENETVEEEFEAGIRLLDVGSDAGSVRIVGSDVDHIEMTAEVSHGLRRTDLDWDVDGDRLVVDTSCPFMFSDFCHVSFTFRVPRDIDLDIDSDSSITVDTIDGGAVLESEGGRIEATRMSGNLDMHSDAGRVVGTDLSSRLVQASSDAGLVELAFSEPPDNVVADSDAGRVEVVLPGGDERAPYRVEADTDAGDEEVAVDPGGPSDGSITATSDAGNVTVRYASS